MDKSSDKVLASVIILDVLALLMVFLVPFATLIGLVLSLVSDADDSWDVDASRIYYEGSWYTDLPAEYTDPIDMVWIIPETAETVENKASYTENGDKSVTVFEYKDKKLDMFLGAGDEDWPELYVKEDYEFPNYRNPDTIESITIEFFDENYDTNTIEIKDPQEIKKIQSDMIRATKKESWKKDAISVEMDVDYLDVYIQYADVGALYNYGSLIPLKEQKNLGISKLMIEDLGMSLETFSDATLLDSEDVLPLSDKSFQIIKKHWQEKNV